MRVGEETTTPFLERTKFCSVASIAQNFRQKGDAGLSTGAIFGSLLDRVPTSFKT